MVYPVRDPRSRIECSSRPSGCRDTATGQSRDCGDCISTRMLKPESRLVASILKRQRQWRNVYCAVSRDTSHLDGNARLEFTNAKERLANGEVLAMLPFIRPSVRSHAGGLGHAIALHPIETCSKFQMPQPKTGLFRESENRLKVLQ